MADVLVVFERENAEGLVAVGSYLSDAAARLGVRFQCECVPAEAEHCCIVSVTSGADLLSEPTSTETEFLKRDGRPGDRLACQARIDRAGEVRVMTKEKKADKTEAEVAAETGEAYHKQFAELPLEKKIAELVKLEAMTVSDTLTFVANSPYTVASKVMDVMAGFGFQAEEEKRRSSRPEEHRENGSGKNGKADSKKSGE